MLNIYLKRGKNIIYEGAMEKYSHCPGVLLIGDKQFFTVEDIVRPANEAKVYSKTAIPAGKYEVKWTKSPRFKRYTLQVMNVPNFEGIRIHSANWAYELEGCIAPGNARMFKDDKVIGVMNSAASTKKVEELCLIELNKSGKVWLTVS